MFSKTIMVGNLTRDIELRYSQGGMAIAKTSIATSRKFKQNNEKKEEVCYIDITFFGRSAEVANQYLRKGSKVLIEGHLVFEQWIDNNGQKRSKHSVTVETMQMLDTKGGSSSQQQGYGTPQQNNSYQPQQQGQGAQQNQSYGAPQQSYQASQQPHQDDIPSIDIDEDDAPPF